MEKAKISCISPTVRPDLIKTVGKCLSRQTYKNFEWLVGTPEALFGEMGQSLDGYDHKLIKEPPKRPDDFYGLNKCWNELYRHAKGELIVYIADGLWFEPDLLERLWAHYINNPLSCVTCVGDQFDKVENGKPENRVWVDP